jgi:hypothetical protein
VAGGVGVCARGSSDREGHVGFACRVRRVYLLVPKLE